VSKLNDFEIKLRRFNLESKLEVCRMIAHSIEMNVPPPKPLKIFTNPQQKRILSDLPKTSFIFEMEYMALASTINGEWKGSISTLSDYEDFRKIINLYKDYGTAPKNEPLEGPEWYMNFIRLGLQQHKLSSLLYEDLVIYDYFYNFEDNSFNLKFLFEAKFKYDYKSYVLFVISLFTLSSTLDKPLELETILNSFSKLKQLNANMIIDMINILSATRDNIVDLHDQYKIPTRKYRNFDYNPYTKYPILKRSNKLFLPVPQYLFGAITEGFYHQLCEDGNLQFREKFGKIVFEKYIGEILERYCKDLTIISEFEYGKEKKRSPDYILVKKKDIIFIEIKATTPAVSLRGNDFEVFKKQLIKGFGNGILQCIKKEYDLNNLLMKHTKFPKRWNNIYYMIIDLEDFHIPPGDLVTNTIKEFCEENEVKYIEERKPLMLSVQLLISIFEEFDGDIFDFMEIWSNDKHIRFPDTYIDKSKVNVKELSSYKYFGDIIESVRNNNE